MSILLKYYDPEEAATFLGLTLHTAYFNHSIRISRRLHVTSDTMLVTRSCIYYSYGFEYTYKELFLRAIYHYPTVVPIFRKILNCPTAYLLSDTQMFELYRNHQVRLR